MNKRFLPGFLRALPLAVTLAACETEPSLPTGPGLVGSPAPAPEQPAPFPGEDAFIHRGAAEGHSR